MGRFFKKLKIAFGKDNSAWHQSAYFYDLYRRLPPAQINPRKSMGGEIFLLISLNSNYWLILNITY